MQVASRGGRVMDRRKLLSSAVGGVATAGLAARSRAAGSKRPPNLIVILCDDLGYGDVAPYGGKIPTPAISRMAREGLVCTDYYAAANLCTPSRAGLLTGRYPLRTGLGYEVLRQQDERRLPH